MALTLRLIIHGLSLALVVLFFAVLLGMRGFITVIPVAGWFVALLLGLRRGERWYRRASQLTAGVCIAFGLAIVGFGLDQIFRVAPMMTEWPEINRSFGAVCAVLGAPMTAANAFLLFSPRARLAAPSA